MSNTYTNGILVESYVNHNDGTATLTDYTTEPPTVTEITGLTIYEIIPDPPSPEVIATQAIHDAVTSRINEATTISEIKVAITEGLDAALVQLEGGQ